MLSHEKRGKEKLNHFEQQSSSYTKFSQNDENEFFTQKMLKRPFPNTKQTPPVKQKNMNKENKHCLDSIVRSDEWKSVFEYDNHGKLTLHAEYEWNATINNWKEYRKVESTYDNNSNLTLEIYYGWNDATNTWKGYNKYEYAYDNNDNLTLEIYYSWNDAINNWKGWHKVESTYDHHSNLTLYADYYWNDSTNTWNIKQKIERTYDLAYSITDLIYSNGLFSANNMLIKETLCTWLETDLIEEYSAVYYWSSKEIGISNICKIKVYPNPTTGQLTIENGELTIRQYFAFNGRSLFYKNIH